MRRADIGIDVDPRSRMFDPNSPDCPPRPPDDPVSHKIMKCVDGKPVRAGLEQDRPHDRASITRRGKITLPRDKDGNVVLDLTGAVQVALLESPNYQQQLETLYLSGLDVTFERFRFEASSSAARQFFHTRKARCERERRADRVSWR